MNIIRFQGENPSVYYEFDKDSMPLGEGGMGRIYQGCRIDTAMNIQTVVAIKCIKPELASHPAVIQRAQREAYVQLDNPGLIRMYGFFSGAEYNQYTGTYVQSFYIAMERLMGVNLDEILFKGLVTDKSGLVVPLAEELYHSYETDRIYASVATMRSVMEGVSYLHQCGFIHRDLDPSNVMVTQEGFFKVIDFGICKKIGGYSYGGNGLTQAGQFLGKVAYAAPELILGDINSQNQTTDIYALGVMFAQLLTGFLPASGTDQEVMDAHLKGKLDLSGIANKRLRKVIEKAVEKDQKKRYQSVREFIEAIDALGIHPQSAPAPQPDVTVYEQPSAQAAPQPAGTENDPSQPVPEPLTPPTPPTPPGPGVPTSVIPICCAAGLVVGVLLAFLA